MQFDINRKTKKKSLALSSGEIDKYQYRRWDRSITFLSKQNNRRI